MGKWIFFAICALTVSLEAGATRIQVCKGFLPENTMRIPVQDGIRAMATGITKAQFDAILNRVSAEYISEVASHGGVFTVERLWNDGTVNANAHREGNKWIITMFGGMARHPAMTYDGFVGIACHETGHHLGGAPLFTGDDWASIEGEADYYAMLKCMKRVFEKDDNEKILSGRKLDPEAVRQCEAEQRGRQDQLLCIRAAMASITLGNVMADLEHGALPKLTTPDKRRVSQVYEDHPRAQCRLDTYFQGSLCRVNFNTAMDSQDYRIGSCADSHTYTRGLRPRCWFLP